MSQLNNVSEFEEDPGAKMRLQEAPMGLNQKSPELWSYVRGGHSPSPPWECRVMDPFSRP